MPSSVSFSHYCCLDRRAVTPARKIGNGVHELTAERQRVGRVYAMTLIYVGRDMMINMGVTSNTKKFALKNKKNVYEEGNIFS